MLVFLYRETYLFPYLHYTTNLCVIQHQSTVKMLGEVLVRQSFLTLGGFASIVDGIYILSNSCIIM